MKLFVYIFLIACFICMCTATKGCVFDAQCPKSATCEHDLINRLPQRRLAKWFSLFKRQKMCQQKLPPFQMCLKVISHFRRSSSSQFRDFISNKDIKLYL